MKPTVLTPPGSNAWIAPQDNLDGHRNPLYACSDMKSCLSLLIAIIIVLVFAGTAGLIWYGSNTTEFNKGPEADTMGR